MGRIGARLPVDGRPEKPCAKCGQRQRADASAYCNPCKVEQRKLRGWKR